MAFGRLERSAQPQPMSDINMTPLIDVMLVLLVIFMITAPLMGSSLKMSLPRTEGASPNDTPQFVGVSIDPQGQLYVGEQLVSTAAFAQRMADVAKHDPGTEVQLRADKGVSYGRVAEVIGMVQKAGLDRIGFVTEAAAASAGAR